MKKRSYIYIWAWGLGLFLGTGQQALCAPTKPVVFVETAKPTEIFDLLTYPARLVSKINATVLSESEGVVNRITTPLGRGVKRGQEIMRLQHTDPVFQYAPVVVRAPVTGVVSSVVVTEGSRVEKGQKLATITDPKKVHITVEIAASDLPTISPGLEGEFKLSGREDVIPVKVVGVSPFVDPGTGTATAELTIEKGKKDTPVLQPGLLGRVYFKVRAHQGLQIPENAVVYRGKDTYLRLIKEGKSHLTPVDLGNSRRGVVEVKEGLVDGSVVVVRASKFISDGEEVTVQNVEEKKTE